MLERLKTILGITDNSQDAALSQLLLDSQEYIESYLDRNLDLDSYQDFATPNGSNSFVLRNYPVTEIANIENLDGEEVYEIEFTAVGGSGTYFWDWDGPSVSTEGGGYGTNVITHVYKSGGTKTVTCQDMGSAEHPEMQGTLVTITNVAPTA